MNWGVRIAFVMAGFVAFILYMVITVSSKTVDLEYVDYYQKELAYEEQIEARRNQNKMDYSVELKQNSESIEVYFVGIENPENITGTIHFFRPSSAKNDLVFGLKSTVNRVGTVAYPKSQLLDGKYIVRINYNIHGVDFFNEQAIFI